MWVFFENVLLRSYIACQYSVGRLDPDAPDESLYMRARPHS
jgi:hypothetical protein